MLKELASIWTYRNGSHYLMQECSTPHPFGIADLISYDYNIHSTSYFEIKVSKSDYYSEKQKRINQLFTEEKYEHYIHNSGINYFWYVVPSDMLNLMIPNDMFKNFKSDVIKGFGYLTFNGRGLKVAIQAPRHEVDKTEFYKQMSYIAGAMGKDKLRCFLDRAPTTYQDVISYYEEKNETSNKIIQ